MYVGVITEFQEYPNGSSPIFSRSHDPRVNSVGIVNNRKEKYWEEHKYCLHQNSNQSIRDHQTPF